MSVTHSRFIRNFIAILEVSVRRNEEYGHDLLEALPKMPNRDTQAEW